MQLTGAVSQGLRAGKQDVDPKKLRQRLQELQKNTEKLKKQGIIRDEL